MSKILKIVHYLDKWVHGICELIGAGFWMGAIASISPPKKPTASCLEQTANIFTRSNPHSFWDIAKQFRASFRGPAPLRRYWGCERFAGGLRRHWVEGWGLRWGGWGAQTRYPIPRYLFETESSSGTRQNPADSRRPYDAYYSFDFVIEYVTR